MNGGPTVDTGFSPWGPTFYRMTVHVAFVVNEVALLQDFF
jgi:hypothetical protein